MYKHQRNKAEAYEEIRDISGVISLCFFLEKPSL